MSCLFYPPTPTPRGKNLKMVRSFNKCGPYSRVVIISARRCRKSLWRVSMPDGWEMFARKCRHRATSCYILGAVHQCKTVQNWNTRCHFTDCLIGCPKKYIVFKFHFHVLTTGPKWPGNVQRYRPINDTIFVGGSVLMGKWLSKLGLFTYYVSRERGGGGWGSEKCSTKGV